MVRRKYLTDGIENRNTRTQDEKVSGHFFSFMNKLILNIHRGAFICILCVYKLVHVITSSNFVITAEEKICQRRKMNNSRRRMVQRESHLRGHSRNFLRRAFYTKMHIFCMDRENGFFSFLF